MIRNTSQETYFNIGAQAMDQRLKMYGMYREFGPMTDKEMQDHTEIPANTVSARRNEMTDVKETDRRKCSITGRRVIVWGLESDQPWPRNIVTI